MAAAFGYTTVDHGRTSSFPASFSLAGSESKLVRPPPPILMPTLMPTEAAVALSAPTSPRSPPRRRPVASDDDDPSSELNSLRRALRRAQAALREAGLQSAHQEEELISIRAELIEAETARDDALAREAALRARLVAERHRVDATMEAAENLINVLRSMDASDAGAGDVLEQGDDNLPPPPALKVPVVSFEDLRGSSEEDVVEVKQGSTSKVFNSPPNTWKQQSIQKPRPQSMRISEPGVPRTQSTPSIRPRSSSYLMQSAFSTAPPGAPVAAVQRSATGALETGVDMSDFAAAVPTTRVPTRVESVHTDAHAGDIFCAATSLDGSLLATGGDDRQIRIVSLRAECTPVVITEPPKSVTALEFLPDEAAPGPGGAGGHAPRLCAGTSDGAVRVFRRAPKRRAKWALELVAPVHTQTVRRIVFRPDGASATCVLTASTDRSVKVTDLHAGQRTFVGTAPSATLDVAAFTGGAQADIISAHKDGALRMWNTRERDEPVVEALRVHSRGAVSVATLGDGRGVVSLGRDNAIRLSDTRMNLRVVREFDNGVETVSDWHRVAVDARLAFCGIGPSGDVGVWNVDTGKMVRRMSSFVQTQPKDVIDLVAKSFSQPAAVVVPICSTGGRFVCAHKTRQVSFWEV